MSTSSRRSAINPRTALAKAVSVRAGRLVVDALESRRLLTAVSAITFDYETSPHKIRVAFTSAIDPSSVSASDLIVEAAGADARVPVTRFTASVNSAHTEATFTLNSIIGRGDFTARVLRNDIIDADGSPLSADATSSFFFRPGDATGSSGSRDRASDDHDEELVTSHLGLSSATFSDGDLNYDGVVDEADYDKVDYGTLLQPVDSVTRLTANGLGTQGVELDWERVSPTATGFVVQRSSDSGRSFTTIASTLPATTWSYVDAGVSLSGQGEYLYRVRSIEGTNPLDGTKQTPKYALTVLRFNSAVQAAPGLIQTPGDVEIAAGKNAATLTWADHSDGEIGYEVFRSTDGTSFDRVARIEDEDTTTWTDTGLAASSTYTYRVRTFSASVTSKMSSPEEMQTLSGAPALIKVVAETMSDNTQRLSAVFDQPIWANVNPLDHTKVSVFPLNDQSFAPYVGGTDYVVEGISGDGTRLRLTIVGVKDSQLNKAGILANGNFEVIVSGDSIKNNIGQTIASSGNPDAEASGTGFFLRGDFDGNRRIDFGDLSILATNYGTTNKLYTQGDADFDGDVDFADLLLVGKYYQTNLPLPPSSPNQLTVTTALTTDPSHSALLQWTAPEISTDPLLTPYDRFTIWRSSDGVDFEMIDDVPASQLNYLDSGLVEGAKYTYRVRPLSPDNHLGRTTNKASVVTTLGGPTNVRADGSDGSTIHVSWTDNSAAEGYIVELCDTSGNVVRSLPTFPSNATNAVISNVVEGGSYRVRVSAVTSAATGRSLDVSVQVGLLAPTNLAYTSRDGFPNRIDLTWSSNSIAATSFRIKIERTSGTTYVTFGTQALATSIDDVSPGDWVRVSVQATKASQTSAYSSSILYQRPTNPDVPIITAAGIRSGVIAVRWGTAYLSAFSYKIYRGTASGFPLDSTSLIATVDGAQFYIDKGLSPGHRYIYRMVAVDEAGHVSPSSGEASALARDEDDDVDNDGILNADDSDNDNDGINDASDPDDDNDGILDGDDADDIDSDNDGIANWLDYDNDNDGVVDALDNDNDNDGILDLTDVDDDNDGTPDEDARPDPDSDNDGIPDATDDDDDNDGINDASDPDDDNDGIPDVLDPTTSPGDSESSEANLDLYIGRASGYWRWVDVSFKRFVSIIGLTETTVIGEISFDVGSRHLRYTFDEAGATNPPVGDGADLFLATGGYIGGVPDGLRLIHGPSTQLGYLAFADPVDNVRLRLKYASEVWLSQATADLRTTAPQAEEDTDAAAPPLNATRSADIDGDGILDFADFDGGPDRSTNEQSVLVDPRSVNFTPHILLRFDYWLSSLDGISASSRVPNPGAIRIWRKPPTESRTAADLIVPGHEYSLHELGWSKIDPNTSQLGRLWVEGINVLVSTTIVKLTIRDPVVPAFASVDQVRFLPSSLQAVFDNNRDGIIRLDGSDLTSNAKPFLFWLNDNREVWGGDRYPAAESTSGGTADSALRGIGSSESADGGPVTGTALREVAERDLEDFGQIGMAWPASLSDKITRFRFSLTSADPAMQLRLFASSRGGHTDKSSFPAVIANDSTAITKILDRDDWPGSTRTDNELYPRLYGRDLWPGNGFTTIGSSDKDFGIDVVDGDDGLKLMQVMFEGVGAGEGTVRVEALNNGNVLMTTTFHLKLRKLSQMYDHYSVSYGPNVSASDGTFGGWYNLHPDVVDNNPVVPSVAQLVGQNAERARFQQQSDDYFLFVHGWRMTQAERVAFAESAFKRMYWSGYKGQFGMFDWPTQYTSDPTSDPGNFDRSEFVAWNSAMGLADAFGKARAQIPQGGHLNVMAHSMGGIVLSEALALSDSETGLVNTAVYSQAALSSHYFNSALEDSIYAEPGKPVDEGLVTPRVDGWIEYNYGVSRSTGLGGGSPQFGSLRGGAASRILNYSNSQDYALMVWRIDQAAKPSVMSGPPILELLSLKDWPPAHWIGLEPFMNGFKTTPFRDFHNEGYEYTVDGGINRRPATGFGPYPVQQDMANRYEIAAFAASSIAPPVGQIDWTSMPEVFDNGVDLHSLVPDVFTNESEGHSGQFMHSYLDANLYWQRLLEDLE